MLYRRQVTASFFNPAVVLPMVLTVLFFSCTIPGKYQANKPFVFKTTIKVEGNLSNNDKQDLTVRLANQLDDSLRTQIISFAGVRKTIVNPPVFDTANVKRSIAFMVSLLNSLGYYAPVIKDTFRIDTVKEKQYRVTIDFRVRPGKNLRFDSIGFDLQTPELQKLALRTKDSSLLKNNKPYSKQVLSAELDRLVELFRNNGYYKFSKEDLYIEHDTVIAALIDPTLDPFEQVRLLEQLKKKRENPTIDVVVKQRPAKDSSHLIKYYIGNVTIYPDLPVLEDTAVTIRTDTTQINGFTIITRSDKFKLPFITSNVYLRPKRLYRQDNYSRTLTRFSQQLQAWQNVIIDFYDSDISDSLLDVIIRLYPAKKQRLRTGLEASRNTNDIVTASNLFGLGVNLELLNRNAYKQSVQTTTSLHGGVELGADFIQTRQASLSHTISFPQIIPFKINREWALKNVQTILNFNASYTDRFLFFNLKSVNGSFGWQWAKNNKTFLWRPLNIEYTSLIKTDSLNKLLANNPSLKLAFKTGLVMDILTPQFVYNSIKQKSNRTNFLRASFEESGLFLGFIKSLDEGALFRFVKADIEYRHHIDYRNTQLAMRAYAGAGFAYGRDGNGYEQTLPFYKAYFAGGPNSMRGWQVRQLGLGSSKYYDTATAKFTDRFGDVQLEGNIEYRFLLGTVFGIKIKSAIYTDVGNIWNRDTATAGKGSDFGFDRFYKELAVDAGTGLRLDFVYFLIRLDWAYKIKDPQRFLNSDKWFYKLTPGSGQFQLGIGYPF